MIDNAVVVRLAVALAATPLILYVARRLDLPGVILPFSIGYAAMVTAYALGALQLAVPAAGLDAASHLCYLVSSAGMLGTALVIRGLSLKRRGLRA